MPTFSTHQRGRGTLGVLLLAGGYLCATTPPRDTPIDSLLVRLRAFSQHYPCEKVYVHTDRQAYSAGDTIWLKSYLFYGHSWGLDSTSGSVLIDLVAPDGRQVLYNRRVRSVGGLGDGYLMLPDTLKTGHYSLRAYTNWMRNFPEEWYFTKPIDVIQTNAPLPVQPRPSAQIDLQFLPEGGQLVAGLQGRLGFKALSLAGMGVNVEGFVLANDRDTVIHFGSQHLGMGQFPFVPDAGKTYKAYARRMGENTPYTAYPLPTVLATGYVMQVDNLSNKDYIRVFVRNNLSLANAPRSPSAANVTLLAQVNGQVVYVLQAPAHGSEFKALIPRDKCPDGIVQLTLFDERLQPVCERLAYVSRNGYIRLTLSPRQVSVGPRQQVEVNVTATDAAGKPVVANVSLAVTDSTQQPASRVNGPSLLTYLLLTSDLRGYIEQPGYYFDEANADRQVQLDLLLMTQGWRRFTWDNVLAKTLPPLPYTIDPGLTLSGMVYRGSSRNPAPGTDLTIMLTRKDLSAYTLAATTDQQGRFHVDLTNLVDTASVYIQARKGANRNFTITLDKPFATSAQLKRPPVVADDLETDEISTYIQRQQANRALERNNQPAREVTLAEVVVRGQKADPYSSQRARTGKPYASFKIDTSHVRSSATIFDVIRRYMPGVSIEWPADYKEVDGVKVFSTDPEIVVSTLGGRVKNPILVVNGMELDVKMISGIKVDEIAYVDVIVGAGAMMLGTQKKSSVALNFITKGVGDDREAYWHNVVPGVRIQKVVGFLPERTFYAPYYGTPQLAEKARPDYRATLHWAPSVQTDASGKATVLFYTSDAKTTLRLRAEGTTLVGQPGVAETTTNVR